MTQVTKSQIGPNELRSLITKILDDAAKLGATSAEVGIGTHKGFSIVARKGDAESVEYNQDKGIDITVYFSQRMGSANVSDLRSESIHTAVEAACNIARYTDADACAGIADKDLLAFNYPDLALSFPWDITVEEAIKMACECEEYALSLDKRIVNSDGVTVSTTSGWHAYGNSHGFIGVFPSTHHEVSCLLIGKQGDEMQRDHSYTNACDPRDLLSWKTIAEQAVERTVRRLGSRRLTTRKVPVIFLAEEARSLLGNFVSAISGGNLFRKSSFLVDHLGKPVFPKNFRIHEEPHLPKGLGSSPFDENGVVTRPNVFVEEGILRSYALGIYAARKLSMQTTGNAGGVHNLFINTGNLDLAGLLKKMGTGLLVTELMGHGTNLVTGDYSRGASGFWVENGEIQYPVSEITIAGNLKDMFLNLVEVGSDVDVRGNVRTGSILIEKMTVAGH